MIRDPDRSTTLEPADGVSAVERSWDESATGHAEVVRAAGMLARAQRPAVVAGGGARTAGAALTALVEELGAIVATSTNGRGAVPESHPASLGATLHREATRAVLADADVVLLVGCELAESDTWSAAPLPLPGTVVRLDVDPSMAAANLDRDPDVLLAGRSENLVPALLDTVRTAGAVRAGARLPWAQRPDTSDSEAPWRGLLAGLAAALPEDAVVTADNAKASYHGAQTGLRVVRPSSYLFPTGFGTLGWAVPAAVGAVLAAPDRPVLALSGDGGLQFTVAELATLRDLRAGVPVVVVDNGGYGEIRDQMLARGDTPVAVDLAPPRWDDLARAYGCAVATVAAPSHDDACADEVAAAVTTAFAADRPTLVVVREERTP